MRNTRTISVVICTYTYIYKSKSSARLSVPCYHFPVSVAHVEQISLLNFYKLLAVYSWIVFSRSDLFPWRIRDHRLSEAPRIFVGFVGTTPGVRVFWWSEWIPELMVEMKKHLLNLLVVLDNVIFKWGGLTWIFWCRCNKQKTNDCMRLGNLWSRSFGAKIVDIRNPANHRMDVQNTC